MVVVPTTHTDVWMLDCKGYCSRSRLSLSGFWIVMVTVPIPESSISLLVCKLDWSVINNYNVTFKKKCYVCYNSSWIGSGKLSNFCIYALMWVVLEPPHKCFIVWPRVTTCDHSYHFIHCRIALFPHWAESVSWISVPDIPWAHKSYHYELLCLGA